MFTTGRKKNATFQRACPPMRRISARFTIGTQPRHESAPKEGKTRERPHPSSAHTPMATVIQTRVAIKAMSPPVLASLDMAVLSDQSGFRGRGGASRGANQRRGRGVG